jgi:hypothetical protein
METSPVRASVPVPSFRDGGTFVRSPGFPEEGMSRTDSQLRKSWYNDHADTTAAMPSTANEI